PPVVPDRDQKRDNASPDERKPDILRRVWQIDRVGPGRMLLVIEILVDGEAEPDQRDRRAQPRHHRAFETEPGAYPAKMAVRGHPDLDPVRAWIVPATAMSRPPAGGSCPVGCFIKSATPRAA